MRKWLPRLCSSLVSLLIGASTSAVTMDWTFVGNPGNTCDSQSQGCFGGVSYSYYIGTYEVTNAEYAEFLNAIAKTDSLGLYHALMSVDPSNGGIRQSGVSGSYTYDVVAGHENRPVNYVSFYDALRFANWMHNGQGTLADTETGAYTLLGGTETPTNAAVLIRNPGAAIALTTENEWYKAAYYAASAATYFDYPTRSNTFVDCGNPTSSPNTANCGNQVSQTTPVGSYTGSASPYGTFDQAGNVWEWNESLFNAEYAVQAVLRGGGWVHGNGSPAADVQVSYPAILFTGDIGFRLVSIPEPSTGLLVIGGLLGFAGCRRKYPSGSSSPDPCLFS